MKINRSITESRITSSRGQNGIGVAACTTYAFPTAQRWTIELRWNDIPGTGNNSKSDTGLTVNKTCELKLSPDVSRTTQASGSIPPNIPSGEMQPINFESYSANLFTGGVTIFTKTTYNGNAFINEGSGIGTFQNPATTEMLASFNGQEYAVINSPSISDHLQTELGFDLPVSYSVQVSSGVFEEDTAMPVNRKVPVLSGGSSYSWDEDPAFNKEAVALMMPIGDGRVLSAKYQNI